MILSAIPDRSKELVEIGGFDFLGNWVGFQWAVIDIYSLFFIQVRWKDSLERDIKIIQLSRLFT